MKRFWLGLVLLLIFGGLSSCAGGRSLMQTAPSIPKGKSAAPAILTSSLEDWDAQTQDIKERLQSEIYGALPQKPAYPATFTDRLVTREAFNGSANISEWSVSALDDIPPFNVVIVRPADISDTAPIPMILMQNFCPNHSVVPVQGVSKPSGDYFSCEGEGAMANIFGYFFGRYITTPPIEMIMKRGYGLAVVYPSEFVPDNSQSASPVLDQLSQLGAAPLGAIGAWAWQASRIAQLLKTDASASHVISYGHSRYGKSALVAAAFDKNIDGVIAHQSGTGGASLSKDKPGETVEAITQSYPHWFTPAYTEADLTLDQHHLLALIAPRPVFLGNAKRDVWSDPEGAFRAAQGAMPIYELFGSNGLTQSTLSGFDPAADIAFWMRPGTHGVVEEDWPAFLEFIDAHFK